MKTEIFQRNIINLYGEQGRVWLLSLDKTLDALSELWELSSITPVANMSWNFVATAIQNHEKPVVLKIGPEYRNVLAEYKALSYFNGCGAIQVLSLNEAFHALLLEQAIPGTTLKNCYETSFASQVSCYAKVVNKLSLIKGAPDKESFEHVSFWLRKIDELSEHVFHPDWISKALSLREELLSTIEHPILCHGDLHLENIILNQDKWFAIDPKGIIGEKAFEAAAFDIITQSEVNAMPEMVTEILAERVQLLALTLDVDESRLKSWIFLRIILSIKWFLEDNGDPQWMLKLAHYFYPLVV